MLHKLNKRAVVIIVAVVAVIAVVGSSFAWFVTRSSLLQNINLAGIDVSADGFSTAFGKRLEFRNDIGDHFAQCHIGQRQRVIFLVHAGESHQLVDKFGHTMAL